MSMFGQNNLRKNKNWHALCLCLRKWWGTVFFLQVKDYINKISIAKVYKEYTRDNIKFHKTSLSVLYRHKHKNLIEHLKFLIPTHHQRLESYHISLDQVKLKFIT